MSEANKGYPIWSEQTEGILWHESRKILMIVRGGMLQHTVHHTLLCVSLHSQKLARVSLLTLVPHQMHL